MKSVPLSQITNNLDNRRIPLNSADRGKLSQTKLYPYIGANNVLEYIGDFIFDEKILCIAEDGGNWGANEVCAKIYNQRCWVNNHAHVLTAKSTTILEYLAAYLNYANLNSYVTGTTRGKLTRKKLDSISIPLPPLEDQKRIAHLLGKVEGLIAQRKQHLQQLDDLLKSVFLKMFGDLQILEGESTLSDCLKIQQGFAFKSEEFIESGIPIIKIGTINKGFFDYSTLSFIADDYTDKVRRFEINPGDLLISLTGTVGKEDYGNTCFVPQNSFYQKYLLNQRVGKLICNGNIAHPLFIDAFLKLPKVKSALIKQNRGVRQANLSNSDIYGIQLSIPPISQQQQFANIIQKAESIKSRYQQSLADLEALYGVLSQQAFKGELDLSRVRLD